MTWTWQYERADGTQTAAPSDIEAQEFADRAEAETWLGQTFQQLLDSGVDTVTLLHDGTAEYSMSLHPQD